jgi:Ser/Thr protein kinase RdoA (MazF antagonist)
MTRWTEGTLLSDLLEAGDASAEIHFEQLGAIEAAMHNQSSGWRPPPGFARHAVDRDGLMGDAPFWGPFWDHPVFTQAERALVIATRDRIRGAMDRYGRDPATFGMIHADLHPGNLLVGGDGLTVIDFDDCAFGWHLYDIAVGLVHQQRSPHFTALRHAFVRGYRTGRPLGDDALALLPMFLLVRGLAQIGWLHQRPEIDVSRTIRATADRLLAQCEAFEVPC